MILRIKNFILNSVKNLALNLRIKKYKYVHIMFNDKFNKPFVDFLNKKFNKQEHFVLCKRWYNEHPFPEGSNVAEIANLRFLNFSKNKKIICHSLFDKELINYLYKHKDILKTKAYWIIWGGDLYDAERDEKNDYVRCNFKGYLSDIDKNFFEEKFSIKKENFHKFFYKFPITLNMIRMTHKINKTYIKIQINNSADKSTLQMLEILSKFKDENIRITTILSYGETEFNNEIIQKGKEIFKNKFEYIDKYMTPQEYAQHLAQNDILVLCQNRQQGFGNTLCSLMLGSKVYIKNEISVYNYLNTSGLKIFDTNEIYKLNFKEFVLNDFVELNRTKVSKYYDDSYLSGLLMRALKCK